MRLVALSNQFRLILHHHHFNYHNSNFATYESSHRRDDSSIFRARPIAGRSVAQLSLFPHHPRIDTERPRLWLFLSCDAPDPTFRPYILQITKRGSRACLPTYCARGTSGPYTWVQNASSYHPSYETTTRPYFALLSSLLFTISKVEGRILRR
ncbi:hypothetical protein DM02DRAFT_330797 [Periconia macrospinosa]|uniref:Uncharacterized protein n=1 Tax=Periconia macrospinosa TaxID=97972 RepID=A0A2V1DXM6_9PLEO|nr:hypothetical protein DM02DRAFT_330797 [Periconia macrospinosa]